MEVERRIKEMGIELPEASKPVGVYVGAKRAGAFVYTAGQGPGAGFKKGKIGRDLTLEEGYEAAKRSAIRCLAQLKAVIGDLDKVESVVRVMGYINSADGFSQQPAVLNGFTELLVKVFGDEVGRPSRAAIAVAIRPLANVATSMTST